ncbi:hypothetical protein DRO66_03785 [Candidatus Bathyarchaeota archaeon]|nr:MAG: hypothetical protein DRO66_03785 [Candidatus Bathyarchaeota archaeon]
MADSRKPTTVVLLRYPSKRGGEHSQKLEFFPGELWGKYGFGLKGEKYLRGDLENRYRMRVNGKWFNYKGKKYTFLTKTEVKELFFRSIHLK